MIENHLISGIFALLVLISFVISIIVIIVGLIMGIIRLLFKRDKQTKSGISWFRHSLKGLILLLVTSLFWIIFQLIYGRFFTYSCFTGDTQVLTINGLKPINKLKKGDRIVSYNLITKEIVNSYIEKTFVRSADELYLINGTLKVTSEHPFAVTNNNLTIWKKAKDLKAGDLLITGRADVYTKLSTIEKINLEKSVNVYNLYVSSPNNYFVHINALPVLVHNKFYF